MWSYVTSVATAVALLALGFVLLVTVGSGLQADRDQRVLYNDYREQLANAIAPVGPLTYEGEPLAPGAPVATIAIPVLGTELVVVEGTASPQTMSGPGHRRDTVLPGQAGVSILYGRQSAYGGPFERITRPAARRCHHDHHRPGRRDLSGPARAPARRPAARATACRAAVG